MIQCNLMHVCGIADQCCHAKPHPGIRCGHCGTKCWDSNGFCNGGLCSQIRGPMSTDDYCAMVNQHGRPRCVPLEEILPTEEVQK